MLLAVAHPSGSSAQILGTSADASDQPIVVLSIHVDQFTFLDLTGFSLRGEYPFSRRFAPFVELTAGRFQAKSRELEFETNTETSLLAGTGFKFFLFGEQNWKLPVSLSFYSRFQLGFLKNIDILTVQSLVLGTYDLSDSLPLLIHLGAGFSFRDTVTNIPGGPELSESSTSGRFLVAIEVPIGSVFSVLTEYGYEQQGSGGLGVRYRF